MISFFGQQKELRDLKDTLQSRIKKDTYFNNCNYLQICFKLCFLFLTQKSVFVQNIFAILSKLGQKSITEREEDTSNYQLLRPFSNGFKNTFNVPLYRHYKFEEKDFQNVEKNNWVFPGMVRQPQAKKILHNNFSKNLNLSMNRKQRGQQKKYRSISKKMQKMHQHFNRNVL